MRIGIVLFVLALCSSCGGDGGGAQAQEAGPTVLAVRNGAGVPVGAVVDITDAYAATVVLTINNALTVFHVDLDGFQVVNSQLYFTSADCTGTPYGPFQPKLINRAELSHNGTWYISPRQATPQMIAIESSLSNGSCNVGSLGTSNVYPTIALTAQQSQQLDLLFTGPFQTALVPADALTGI